MASKSLKLMTVLIASEADIAVSDFRGWGQSRSLLQAPKGLMFGLARFQWTVQKDPVDCASKSSGLMLPI